MIDKQIDRQIQLLILVERQPESIEGESETDGWIGKHKTDRQKDRQIDR